MTFLGFRKDVARIMHTADVLVIPSIWEGFGLIAVEGMACGIPIVASNVPGLSEVVGNAGIKFNPKDASSIADSVIRLISSQPNQYLTLGYKRVQDFDVEKTTAQYLALYKKLNEVE